MSGVIESDAIVLALSVASRELVADAEDLTLCESDSQVKNTL